ncbi:MAG: 1,4-dihydroxy-2-naphthoate octaprenyltransferase [Muribaculaceae bacterium]|nr:1,4-dihydroxy-2-naphthoate octaprenyltransferase [Muribaculaceae bacterium]
MKQIKIWLEAIRLRTLPVSVSGVLIAVGLAKFNGAFRLVPSLLCVAFAVLAQIVSNLANEYFDFKAGTDKKGRVGPRRGVTEGDFSPATLKRAMVGTLVATCAVGLSMLAVVDPGEGYANWLLLVGVGVMVAVMAFAYSAGPYPLSYHALGEVAVMAFYGLVPVIFSYYVVAGDFHPYAVIAGIAIGLMGVNVLLVNNYRDVDDDREAGKRTSVVVAGRTLAAFAYLLNGLLALSVLGVLWLRLWMEWGWWTMLPPAIYMALHLTSWHRLKQRTGAALNPILGATARNMLIFTLLLTLFLF